MSKLMAHHRPHWKTHIGFLLAAIGSAIGLGNIWRFPYLCYKNGGGAFLIPYLIALFIVGIPLMIMEISLGHKMRGSAPASFASISKKWEWLGWWSVIFVMFGIVLYYAAIISWCLNYFFFSFNLKWATASGGPEIFFNQFVGVANSSGETVITSPFQLGNISGSIVMGLFVIWILNWLIVFLGVGKGLEKANKIFMPLLFVLTLILVFWGLRLPGAKEGVAVYLKPNFDRLWNVKVWIDAFSQIFFTLSLAFGIMIAYASYLPKKSDIVKDSIVISCVNSLFSLIAGFGVFAIVGYMSYKTGKPIEEVVKDPINLAFVVYPEAISLLPSFSHLFGILFFGSLVLAGLSSSISILEAFTSGLIDKFHYVRKTVVSILAVCGFLGGIIFATQAGKYWIDIVDHYLTNYGLILVGFFECLVVGWFYKSKRLREHINHYSNWKVGGLWELCIKVAIPAVLISLFISSLYAEIKAPYGGYSRLATILIGRDWLIITLFFAIIVATRPWKIEPKDQD